MKTDLQMYSPMRIFYVCKIRLVITKLVWTIAKVLSSLSIIVGGIFVMQQIEKLETGI